MIVRQDIAHHPCPRIKVVSQFVEVKREGNMYLIKHLKDISKELVSSWAQFDRAVYGNVKPGYDQY